MLNVQPLNTTLYVEPLNTLKSERHVGHAAVTCTGTVERIERRTGHISKLANNYICE
jgi:hypothetical protein